MKRSYTEGEVIDSITMANCLMLLSQGNNKLDHHHHHHHRDHRGMIINNNINSLSTIDVPNRVFECKTCNRQFPSFQALGGHRASHKKPRLTAGDDSNSSSSSSLSPAKPKTHECSICGLEFAIGQALGGHMRRHRTGLSESHQAVPFNVTAKQEQQVNDHLKKSGNGSSRGALCLDLNLTPFENDLELFKLGKSTAPMVDCFL